jgi:tape measure domain-containing protein
MSRSLSFSLTAPLVGFGAMAIQAAGQAEAMRKALETTMEASGRSIADATNELKLLREAAKAPGLDFEQAVKGSVRLQNVGFSAEKARDILIQLANAVAMSGGSAQELDGVTKQFGQMIAKGRVMQEDLGIIQENMPAVSKAMEDAFGTKSAEKLRKMGVTAEQFVDGVTKQLALLPRVSGGITNAIVNTRVAVTDALAKIGTSLDKTFDITGRLDQFATWITSMADRFAAMDEGTKKVVIGIGLFAAALGPAIKLGQLMVSGVSSMMIAFMELRKAMIGIQASGFIGWLRTLNISLAAGMGAIGIAAGVIAAAVIAFQAMGSATRDANEAQLKFNAAQITISEEAARETVEMQKNISVLKNITASTGDRKSAIDSLKSAYPDYLRGMDLERMSVDDLTQLQSGLTDEILRSVAARQRKLLVDEQLNKAASAMIRMQDIQTRGFEALSGEEVRKSGRSIFGTEFEKGFVSAEARTRVVADVMKILSNEIEGAKTQADQIGQLFDKTFPIVDKGRDAYEGYRDAVQGAKNGTVEIAKELEKTNETTKKGNKEVKEAEVQYGGFADNVSRVAYNLMHLREVQAVGRFVTKMPKIAAPSPVLGTNQFGVEFKGVESLTAAEESTKRVTSAIIGLSFAIGENQDKINGWKDAFANWRDMVEEAANAAGTAIMETASDTTKGFREIALAAASAAARVVRSWIQQGVAGAVSKALTSIPFPFNLAAGAAAGGVAAGLFGRLLANIGVPALAGGGLAFAPTLAMVGDNRGASVDPEVIAPLSKLRTMMGGGSTNVTGQFVIRGSDLVAVLDKGKQNQKRYRGF